MFLPFSVGGLTGPDDASSVGVMVEERMGEEGGDKKKSAPPLPPSPLTVTVNTPQGN